MKASEFIRALMVAAVLVAPFGLVIGAAQVVHLDIQGGRHLDFRRLDENSTITAGLANIASAQGYYVDVTVGTPPQSMTLQIDTGSSDTWLPASNSSMCSEDGLCSFGNLDVDKSSSFSEVGQSDFLISYADGTGVRGDYFTDVFGLGGQTVGPLEMGLARAGTVSTGIMGIGFEDNEAILDGDGDHAVYINLPYALLRSGLIPTVAYSLWLNDLDASKGSILFGGIDTEKFIGELKSIPILQDALTSFTSKTPFTAPRNRTEFKVSFTSLSLTSDSGAGAVISNLTDADYESSALFDSGTTLTYLPADIVRQLYSILGSTGPIFPCALADKGGFLSFGFGGKDGPVIHVPLTEILVPAGSIRNPLAPMADGGDACELGIQETPLGAPNLFGDTFLRSAYVVYDLTNKMIALANTNFNSTTSNIVPFKSLGAAIPTATGVVAGNVEHAGTSAASTPRGIFSHWYLLVAFFVARMIPSYY